MDLVEFVCKFGSGDKEYLTHYCKENGLLYSILKEHELLDCSISKDHHGISEITYVVSVTDKEKSEEILKEYSLLNFKNCEPSITLRVSKDTDDTLSVNIVKN